MNNISYVRVVNNCQLFDACKINSFIDVGLSNEILQFNKNNMVGLEYHDEFIRIDWFYVTDVSFLTIIMESLKCIANEMGITLITVDMHLSDDVLRMLLSYGFTLECIDMNNYHMIYELTV